MITYPIDWNEVVLGDIAPLRGGFAFSSDRYSKLGIPIVRITNILSNGSVGGDFVYYSESVDDGSYILPDKSLVVAMSGATTGKVATLYCRNGDKYYQNQRVGYFQEIKGNDYTFISHLVKSSLFSKQIKDVLVAGAQPNVSPKDINSFKFSIPQQIKEQQAIASALSDFDEHIDNLSELIEKKKAIRDGALEDLINGETRRDGFNDEWKTVSFNQVIKPKARIGWQGLKKDEYLRSGYSYLIGGTDFQNGTVNLDNISYVSKERYDMDSNIQVESNNVLVTKDGTIGKVALVPKLDRPATLNSGVFVFRTTSSLLPIFLYRVLLSSVFREFINTLSAGSTIKHLYQKDLSNFEFKIPQDTKEQEAIALILTAMDEEIESLEVEKEKMLQIKEGAMDDLLTGRVRLKV